MNQRQWLLKWLLIISGFFLMTAFLAALLPVSWMAESHRWLGLGDFPNFPITAYLARSTSLLYGVHGTMMLFTGYTLQHHWRLVPLFAWLHISLGIMMFFVDVTAPMPLYWIVMEGPPVAGLGCLMLWLAKTAGPFDSIEDQ